MSRKQHQELVNVLIDIKKILSNTSSGHPLTKDELIAVLGKIDFDSKKELTPEEKKKKKLEDEKKEFNNFVSNAILDSIQKIAGIVKEVAKNWSDLQDASYKLGRNIGFNKDGLESFYLSNNRHTRQMAKDLGITNKELLTLKESYIDATGRAQILNEESVKFMASMQKITSSESIGKMVSGIDAMGGSVDAAMSNLWKSYNLASKWGLNVKKNAELVAENIHLATTYSFQKGTDGLVRMVSQAQKLKIDMNSITSAAEKFMTLEGAISTSANLQVLGGTFASYFSNPLEAAYDAVYDMEAFQNRIVETFSDKGFFNQSTGVVEFDPVTKMMIRSASESLGVSYKDIMTMASQTVKTKEIESLISNKGLNNDDVQLLSSLARYDQNNNEWVVDILDNQGKLEKTIALSMINQHNIDEVKKNRGSQEQSYNDIATIRDTVVKLAKSTKSFQEMWGGYQDDLKSFGADAINPIGRSGQNLLDSMPTLGIAAASTVLGSAVTLGGMYLTGSLKNVDFHKILQGNKNSGTNTNFRGGNLLNKIGRIGTKTLKALTKNPKTSMFAIAALAAAGGLSMLSSNNNDDKDNVYNSTDVPYSGNEINQGGDILAELKTQTSILTNMMTYDLEANDVYKTNRVYNANANYMTDQTNNNGDINYASTLGGGLGWVGANYLASEKFQERVMYKYGDKLFKMSTNLAKGMKVANPLGFLSLGSEILQTLTGNDNNKTWTVANGALNGATWGAMAGSLIPVIGPVIGAIGGGLVGTLKSLKDSNKTIEDIPSKLQGTFETSKFGVSSINDPQLEVKSYYATIKIHDLLITWFNAISKKEKYKIDFKKGLNDEQISQITSNGTTAIIEPQVRNVESIPTVGESSFIYPVSTQTVGYNMGGMSNLKHTLDLNVNGNLRLIGDFGSVNIDINKLLNSPEFKNKIIEMVQNGLMEKQNLGRGMSRDSMYSRSNYTTNHSQTSSI